MIRQKVTVGLVIGWHRYLAPADAAEMAVVVFSGLVFPQGGREADGVVVGRDGDEAFVESLVVEGREADAVLGIEALILVRLVCPGYDMAGQ